MSYNGFGLLLKQEKEYKEALDGFNEKSKEKAQLMTTLTEVKFKCKFTPTSSPTAKTFPFHMHSLLSVWQQKIIK